MAVKKCPRVLSGYKCHSTNSEYAKCESCGRINKDYVDRKIVYEIINKMDKAMQSLGDK